MRQLIFFFLLYLLSVQTTPLLAQFQGRVYEQYQDATVIVNGNTLTAPWCGGVNSTQIIHADLNNDNKKDLVLYDQNSYLLRTFINIGLAGEIKYRYDPMYEKNFPPILNYLMLKDYNCDGVPDLFHKGLGGVSVYKGIYQFNELKFVYYKELYFPGLFGPVNVFVQPDDIPAIMDADKDGDLDVIAFGINGTYLHWYKNMQVELGLPCDSMRMELFDNCYGKCYQGVDRAVVTGITCKGVSSDKKLRHTGNCITILDIEGDGDFDFLGGNISYNDAQLLFNTGSNAMPTYTVQDTLYQSGGHSLYLPSWPAPFHVDIDNDNDKDILFTSHFDNASTADYQAVAYYKNIGNDVAPVFVFQHDTLLTMDMIDAGSYSYPCFFDYDKDGKKDLFIGTEGRLENNTGIRICKLAYYRNTSTLTSISFTLESNDFLQLSTKNYKGIFPTFGDITGDGIDDLVMGNIAGTVAVYKNNASSNIVTPNFLFFTDSLDGVSVGQYSSPVVYDINQDGKTDLLIGDEVGHLHYYKDTSSVSVKKLALETNTFGSIKAGDVNQLYGYCAPFIGKMDNTNKDYLLLGNIDGTIARYDSFLNNTGSIPRIDSNYSLLQTPRRSVPAVADLNGDGKYEMVIGNKLGGLNYFKQVKIVSSTDNIQEWVFNDAYFSIYPNPVENNFQIQLDASLRNKKVHIELVDVLGNRCLNKFILANQQHIFSINHLSAGVYFVRCTIDQQYVVKKLIKQ